MFDTNAFFRNNPLGVMATTEDGTPRTRVFQLLWTDDQNRCFFCTSNKKDVFTQLQKNPFASFCAWNPKTFETVSVSGAVHFMQDRALKSRALDENPSIKGIYQSPDNPDFEVFCLAVQEIRQFDFTHGTSSQRLA